MHFIALAGLSGVVSGTTAGVGLFIALFWILASIAGTHLFANRSLKLIAIDSSNYILLFTFSG